MSFSAPPCEDSVELIGFLSAHTQHPHTGCWCLRVQTLVFREVAMLVCVRMCACVCVRYQKSSSLAFHPFRLPSRLCLDITPSISVSENRQVLCFNKTPLCFMKLRLCLSNSLMVFLYSILSRSCTLTYTQSTHHIRSVSGGSAVLKEKKYRWFTPA